MPLLAFINPFTHANLLGVLAVILSVVVFVIAYRQLRNRPEKVRLAWLAVLVPLSLPALSFAFYYTHRLPEMTWYYTLRSYPGTEFFALFLAAAAGVVATLVGPRLASWILPMLLIATGLPHIKPFIGPIPEDRYKERTWKGAYLQSTLSTCGPASLVNILQHLGHEASEREIAHAAFSYMGGTEAWYLARYVRHCGLHPRFVFTETFVPEAGLPAVVGVVLPGGGGHFIAVLDLKDGQVSYVDPISGGYQIPLAEFQQRHAFTGFHLVVRREG